jgi:hypothetical protein
MGKNLKKFWKVDNSRSPRTLTLKKSINLTTAGKLRKYILNGIEFRKLISWETVMVNVYKFNKSYIK